MIPFHSFKPEIEFKDITFAYPTRPEQVRKWKYIFIKYQVLTYIGLIDCIKRF